MEALFPYLEMIRDYDYETYLHSIEVATLAYKIGKVANLFPKELDILLISSLLHDVGKIKVPIQILHKPDRLDDEEWQEITKHPTYGVEILSSAKNQFSSEVIEAVACHHEFYDGSGYPRGLKGEKIPSYARIIAIADAFHAMTTQRPYHTEVLDQRDAMLEISIHAGTQFDPDITRRLNKQPVLTLSHRYNRIIMEKINSI